jgi:hypothetical protein
MLEELVGSKAKQFTEQAMRAQPEDEEVNFGDDDSGEDTFALRQEGVRRMHDGYEALQADVAPGTLVDGRGHYLFRFFNCIFLLLLLSPILIC